MKIAVLGKGRMGALVKTLALQQGFEVVDASKAHTLQLEEADVCIDFSHASQVPEIVEKCIQQRVPLVIGTTGWDDQREWVKEKIADSSIGCVYSANYSVGVFLMEHLLNSLNQLLKKIPEPKYDLAIHEVHHAKKVDSPSGTALQLANQLKGRPLSISSTRCGSMPGTHTLFLDSLDDTIELTHRAKNRTVFAQGALQAARLILSKKGIYTFNDLLLEAYEL